MKPKIVIKEPVWPAWTDTCEFDLKDMQEIVGGYIEVVAIGPNLLMVCNEEGKQRGLQPNFKLGMDVICGTVFFCAKDGEEFAGLSDEQVEQVTDWVEGLSHSTIAQLMDWISRLEGDPDEC